MPHQTAAHTENERWEWQAVPAPESYPCWECGEPSLGPFCLAYHRRHEHEEASDARRPAHLDSGTG